MLNASHFALAAFRVPYYALGRRQIAHRMERIDEVAAWRLCLGCGACAVVCPQGAIRMVDVEEQGLRPQVEPGRCTRCGTCLAVCPGVRTEAADPDDEAIAELSGEWGNVLEVWEGHATDPEIRFAGSSGGAATALSLYALEQGFVRGVLHVGAAADNPLRNVAVVSRDRAALLARAGSRYAPAAPCLGLPQLAAEGGRYGFVGKPCDVAALRKWQSAEPEAAGTIAVAISIFCAGTPGTAGTHAVLHAMGVEPPQVTDLRYRGHGWPGETVARVEGDTDGERSMGYAQSWGAILTKYVPLRCRLCPESTGELADIACGDPWYRTIEPGDPGHSLVLVRTPLGRRIVHAAMEAGYVHLERIGHDAVPRSQPWLLQRRRHVWGRLATLRDFGVPTPEFPGFPLAANWRRLSLTDKIFAVLSTVRRIYRRKWSQPLACGHRLSDAVPAALRD